ALWLLIGMYRNKKRWRPVLSGAAGMVCAWIVGFLLAAPYLLPLAEYLQTGSRMSERSSGAEERPPVGLAALPQIVVPKMYGTSARGSARLGDGNLLESSAATYVGLPATLLLAPLAWCSRRHRALNW